MNIPVCLQNFIGVCQSEEPASPSSGYYINDLEGVNLEFAAAVADSNYKTGIDLLEKKIAFATAYTVNDLNQWLLPFFRVNSTVDDLRIGEFKTTFLTPSAADRGVRIKITESRMMKMRIDRVKINIQEAAFAHILTITDGQSVTNYDFTTDANGDAEIQTNYTANTRDVYVTMDNTAINPNSTDVRQGCNCYTKDTRFLRGRGWSGLSQANSTYGIQVFSTAECDQEELACAISHRLALPILYQSGIQIVKELLTTSRLNSFTILDKEKGGFMLQEFENEYKKSINILSASLPDLMNRIDHICVVCNGTRYVQGLP